MSELADPLVPAPLDESSGFAGVIVSGEKRTIQAWWKGEVPSRVLDLVDVARLSGVELTILPAKYSRKEMRESAVRILQQSDSSIPPGYKLESVEVDEAGQGVSVDYSAAGASRAGSVDDLQMVVSLEQSVRAASMIDVLAVRRANGVSEFASRQDDRGPWYGGGMIVTGAPGFGVCSTGFAGSRNVDGRSVILSAAHCSDWGRSQYAWYDGTRGANGIPAGELVATWPNITIVSALDSMSMLTQYGSSPFVFGGPWNAPDTHPRYTLGVAGALAVTKGGKVCSSGANSGEHCNLTVGPQKYTYSRGPNGTTPIPVWEAYGPGGTVAGSVAVSQGDSGGPVYVDRGNGTVWAQGIISKLGSSYDAHAEDAYACRDFGVAVRFGSMCSNMVGFVDINDVLAQRGITLKTSS